jgi:hypothetical protein
VHAVHEFERSRSPLTAAEFRAVQDQGFGDDVERARLRPPTPRLLRGRYARLARHSVVRAGGELAPALRGGPGVPATTP